ncbi:hypothetical protein PMW_145 [Pseudomonas phage phiPMW]|uniref:Uncharacterized protein n=1 Tax=Pseudomonas phage phiPMW TaxID=1815582 RepID=A0A1S5R1H4_9CAUD|nr:hypothetical protein FDG97_gp205 [Pseudomonas phage phiPMW]ANA49270.1 hypothetical protein PMW_145 [Pseudomonas phage phiPMW]
MAGTGFELFNESGQILLATDKILYGLLKSDYVQLSHWMHWYTLRSANLRPDRESSWSPEGGDGAPGHSPIAYISVANAIAPICFVAGDHVPYGTSVVGNVTTFWFHGVFPNTKAYIFDLMNDRGTKAGFQTFNSAGQLTFTSEMPSLNILSVVSPPPPVPTPNYEGYFNSPYTGATFDVVPYYWDAEREGATGGAQWRVWRRGIVTIPTGLNGELATKITFTRNAGISIYDSLNSVVAAIEGCGSSGGNVRFFFMPDAFSLKSSPFGQYGGFQGIPTDRYPQVLSILTSDYPFPFQA